MPDAAKPVTYLLIEARAVIAEPFRWCQGATARDDNGEEISPLYDEAAQFCIYGALYRAAGTVNQDNTLILCTDLLKWVANVDSVSDWQDDPERTHAEVLVAFDWAIALSYETA
jgi:hypothetical protein